MLDLQSWFNLVTRICVGNYGAAAPLVVVVAASTTFSTQKGDITEVEITPVLHITDAF